jgi:hypothetical protein
VTIVAGGRRSAGHPFSLSCGNRFWARTKRSVKQEFLSKLILFGEASLRRALGEFVAHFHVERELRELTVDLAWKSVSENDGRTGSVQL